MVLSWVSAGLHLGVSVGLGDFCVNPDAYIERLGSKDIESGKQFWSVNILNALCVVKHVIVSVVVHYI